MSNRAPDKNTRLRVVVRGYIVRGPVGGLAWHHLQYVMGLNLLKHDAYFVEDSGDSPWSCYDPVRHVTDSDPTYGLSFAQRTFDQVGLGDRWAYHDAHRSRWLGPCADRIRGICATADVLLNLFPEEPLLSWLAEIPSRVLIDTDPVFTQIRHLADPDARNRALEHTAFLSFGENLASPRSPAPDDGLPWQPTRQPILTDAWPVTLDEGPGKFTTIMQWESYPPAEYGGVRYGMKSESFGPYLDLPRKAGRMFEVAMGTSTAPRALLRSRGWAVRNPLPISRDLWTYQRYIQRSKAEFTVAKHGYVAGRTGWFSERSACYLASGRPVVVQETGFSDWLPTGAGVIPFRTPEEAIAGVREVNGSYQFHSRAAREIAEEYFDARKVLSRVLDCAMNAESPSVRRLGRGM